MADWQRRHKTSLKRRRTTRTPTRHWTDTLRSIAWPIGEDRELTLWKEAMCYVPMMLVLACLVYLVWWGSSHTPIFPGNRQQREAAWGRNVDLYEFLWEEFCSRMNTTKSGRLCHTYEWLPPTTAVLVCVIGGLGHRIAWHT